MKNISLFIALTLLFACQSEVKVDTTDVDEKFAKNCLTVKSYLDDFVKESVDYDKYYNDTCLIRGTMISSEGPMNLDQRKATHKDLWAKYDFSNSDTIKNICEKIKNHKINSENTPPSIAAGCIYYFVVNILSPRNIILIVIHIFF